MTKRHNKQTIIEMQFLLWLRIKKVFHGRSQFSPSIVYQKKIFLKRLAATAVFVLINAEKSQIINLCSVNKCSKSETCFETILKLSNLS